MKSIQPILFWIFIFGLSTSPALFSLSNDTIVIYHKYHSTIFSKSKHFPVVVKYWLTRAMLDCEHRFKRANQFMPDPLIPEFSNLDNDYKHSGYDRGYQMDAYNCVCDSVVIIESFFYSNVAPQSTALNRCNWKHLEEYIRRLVKEYDSVFVWCGSVSLNDKHIGSVAVPDFCWEALYYI